MNGLPYRVTSCSLLKVNKKRLNDSGENFGKAAGLDGCETPRVPEQHGGTCPDLIPLQNLTRGLMNTRSL